MLDVSLSTVRAYLHITARTVPPKESLSMTKILQGWGVDLTIITYKESVCDECRRFCCLAPMSVLTALGSLTVCWCSVGRWPLPGVESGSIQSLSSINRWLSLLFQSHKSMLLLCAPSNDLYDVIIHSGLFFFIPPPPQQVAIIAFSLLSIPHILHKLCACTYFMCLNQVLSCLTSLFV